MLCRFWVQMRLSVLHKIFPCMSVSLSWPTELKARVLPAGMVGRYADGLLTGKCAHLTALFALTADSVTWEECSTALSHRWIHGGNSQVACKENDMSNWQVSADSVLLSGGGFLDRDSWLDTATGYELDGPESECRWGWEFPHSSKQALWPTQPSCAMGTGFLSRE